MKKENEIQMVRIDQIRILNPRVRDKKKFETIVESIKTVGLKKPIQISRRLTQDGEEPGYDLVCGQGRIEAFMALGHVEIPAEVVEIPKQERMLRSLVENFARRPPSAFALMQEIQRLRQEGYTQSAIGEKLGMAGNSIAQLMALNSSGEERLIFEVLHGYVPLWTAVEISKADSAEAQKNLLQAYQRKEIGQSQIRAIRRLMEQRSGLGKALWPKKNGTSKTSSEAMVAALRREGQRLRLQIKKARLCDSLLVVLVAAFRKLVSDEDFINLLRAEQLSNIPSFLAEKISTPNES